MSLREEILAVLTDHPEGLTSKEIAKQCPSCEYCPVTVGGMVGTLKREGVIYADGFGAAGETRYKFGAAPKSEPVNEPRLPTPATTKEAARAIAGMRATKPAPAQASGSADSSTAGTTAAPAQAAGDEEQDMIQKKIEGALRAGPLSVRALMRHAKAGELAVRKACTALVDRKVLVTVPGSGPTRFALAKKPEAPRPGLPGPAPRATRRKAAKKKATRTPAKPAPAAPSAPTLNGDSAVYAISEVGELGIEKDGSKVKLDRAELYRLRQFIERCSPILEGADA